MAGLLNPGRNDTPEQRLLFYGWDVSEGGCWLWKGSKSAGGYGQLMIARKQLRTHRVAYEVWVRPLTEDEVVLHTCDTPLCINPEHLIAGSQGDNMADKMRKQRHIGGGQKLTAKDVQHIREGCDSGLITQKMAAELYGISREAAHKIVRRITWKGVV